jgi:hypothetical protein
MRRIVCTALLLAGLGLPAYAEDTAALLLRADQAFAGSDYATALALYKKLEPLMSQDERLAALQERMRVAERQLAAAATPATQPTAIPPDAAAGAPSDIPTDPDKRKKHAKPADGQAIELSLHELGNFNYREDDDSTIPADVTALSGSTVRLTGQMLPLDQAGRVTRFLLVNDLMSCCYGVAPKLQNVVKVTLPKDKAMAATTMRIMVEGKLKVKVEREEEFVINIFELEPTSVKYAPQ